MKGKMKDLHTGCCRITGSKAWVTKWERFDSGGVSSSLIEFLPPSLTYFMYIAERTASLFETELTVKLTTA